MIRMTLEEISDAVRGRLVSLENNISIRGVSTDSRTIKDGELFFALKGAKFNGCRFVADAIKKGASGAVVSSECEIKNSEFRMIVVDDTIAALGDLAEHWRKKHPVPLVAVSGSCGKTTTKEMIASILNISRCVLKTEGNLNNLIGLPLTVFGLNNIHKAVVLELGISKRGEMERLVRICSPDVAVLTNIGEAHAETLGGIDGVADAKGELFRVIDADGIAAVNIDDPWIHEIAKDIRARRITFSLKSKADVMLKDYNIDSLNGVSATFIAMGVEIPVRLRHIGMHNLSNAAAAITAALPLGATKEEIADGLSSLEPVYGRMSIIRSQGGITIINDTYNANPLSMEASLKTVGAMQGRKIVVLGDMLELGKMARKTHRMIGRLVHDFGIGLLIATGEFGSDLIKGATESGMGSGRIYSAKDKEEAISLINGLAKAGDIILIKGSRAMGMEEIVNRLKEGGEEVVR